MKKILSFFVSLTLLSGFFAFVYGPQPVMASDAAKDAICSGIVAAGEDCGTDADADSSSVSSTIETVINILSVIGAVIAVIMIIIGGMKFITSQGDGNSTAGARNTIIYAVVGLVIIALAQVIVQFVVGRVGSDPPASQNVPPPLPPDGGPS